MEILFNTNLNHLGVLIGDHHSRRIIALLTSDVFSDKTLIPTFWEMESEDIDNGFQAHLYTRPNDILALRVPLIDYSILEKVSTAITQNYEIWHSMTGIQLSSLNSNILLVSDYPPPTLQFFSKTFLCYQGNLLDAAAFLFKKTNYSFLAFLFNKQVMNTLDIYFELEDKIKNIADSISFLMDKNSTFELLDNKTMIFPKTYLFNKNNSLDLKLDSIPSSNLYVFKSAGGAAGIGLYNNKGFGANREQIYEHINELKIKNKLPDRFQIQEFLSGEPYGVSAFLDGNGSFEILEIHKQIINPYGKFIGGQWRSDITLKQMEVVKKIYTEILATKQLKYAGLLCLDFIDGKVIDINPRITASAPIAHILRIKNTLIHKYGSNFQINQIDLNTDVSIPFEIIRNGILRIHIEKIWRKYKVICLPQGLNPFGTSRMVFINDSLNRTAQKEFMKNIHCNDSDKYCY